MLHLFLKYASSGSHHTFLKFTSISIPFMIPLALNKKNTANGLCFSQSGIFIDNHF